MRFKIILSGLLIATLLLAVVLGWLYRDANSYDVTKPQRGSAVLAVYATGTVEASVTIPVAPRQSARLMQLFVDEGQSVTKGMVMAQLEDTDLQNTVIERKTSLDLAQKEYDRQLKLLKTGAIAKQSFDKAQAALDSAKANLAQAQASLSYLKLIAPEDGTVIRRDGEIGELIPTNQPVLWLSCCAGLRVSTEVDEEDIALVKPGQDVVIRADAFPEDIFKGKVQSITPKGDSVARSYRVRISLDKDSKLMIGMTAETNIMISEDKNALLVPTAAVADGKIQLISNGAVKIMPVKTSVRTDTEIQITEGISDDSIILTKFQKDLEDGRKLLTRFTPPTNTSDKNSEGS